MHTRGDHMLRGNGEGNAWPISVRQAAEKIEQQAQTLKGKWNERKRKGARRPRGRRPRAGADAAPAAADRPRDALRRSSRCRWRTRRCASTATPESFVVFRNADTDAVSILYRRKDGNLG